MKIILQSERTIGEVKEEFNRVYPFLKIEFFTKSSDPGRDSPGSEEIDSSTELIDVTGVLKEGAIDINPTDTVKEVEKKFEHQYGLPVHIFRKQKGVWLGTTITDDLTLQEQNTWGREASKPLKIKMEGHYHWK
jgi:hypothetical protein